MSIQSLNDLALDLVARDFSNGHDATNAGPTKTSRALAIIHLAAHDATALHCLEVLVRIKNETFASFSRI